MDDPSLRSKRALQDRLDKMQSECIRRYQNLIQLAVVDNNDRTAAAATQLQMRTETAALIRSFEDIATLVRQLQELWLRGPLNTLGDSKAKQKLDENAKDVADLLRQLTGVQQGQEAPAG